jgi:hypothetical protein
MDDCAAFTSTHAQLRAFQANSRCGQIVDG